ncbi:MAG: hypothetical protein ACI3ZP_04975, partial [Candidatus Cryptobacteroides sp.]
KVPYLSSRPSEASGEIFRKDLIFNRYLDYALRASLDMTGFRASLIFKNTDIFPYSYVFH